MYDDAFCWISAVARALEDYQKRKEAGEIPEVLEEEEDIYAVAAEVGVRNVKRDETGHWHKTWFWDYRKVYHDFNIFTWYSTKFVVLHGDVLNICV